MTDHKHPIDDIYRKALTNFPVSGEPSGGWKKLEKDLNVWNGASASKRLVSKKLFLNSFLLIIALAVVVFIAWQNLKPDSVEQSPGPAMEQNSSSQESGKNTPVVLSEQLKTDSTTNDLLTDTTDLTIIKKIADSTFTKIVYDQPETPDHPINTNKLDSLAENLRLEQLKLVREAFLRDSLFRDSVRLDSLSRLKNKHIFW